MGKHRAGEGSATSVDDQELLSWWSLVCQGYHRTGSRVVAELGVDVPVPGPWFEVLSILLDAPGHRLSMTRLAHEVSLTSGGFTKFADRLCGAGLLERQSCSTDRRVVYAALTARGLELAREARSRHAEALRRHFLQPLGPGAAHRLAELMRVLRDADTGELAACEGLSARSR